MDELVERQKMVDTLTGAADALIDGTPAIMVALVVIYPIAPAEEDAPVNLAQVAALSCPRDMPVEVRKVLLKPMQTAMQQLMATSVARLEAPMAAPSTVTLQ